MMESFVLWSCAVCAIARKYFRDAFQFAQDLRKPSDEHFRTAQDLRKRF
ncbi:hypothetical protein [Bergeyella cardium]|uniref:Uncharacterized protein n=1 Tax=Bergeyella cardium TaxID=1585976 RepID=A0A6P1QVC7_9FLAO|nr:hypothetical protein [Bergeyella cardium]QHN65759.1 hypothetical protein DBX24_07625 [Bergeyella cardium]WHE33349.1 hypothetical protein P8603_07665 [Bergeyella cardium]WHF59998.1 hypothetical protein O0R51_07660 [Bergeyella cardium]